ncbi:MAG TPA: NlpC/P60 family protein [Limnobacter sp.]|nr:NlpC/P60 family protein [Limnobacter sp.]
MYSKPYKWGGKTKEGFDCSGFVAFVFSSLFPENKGKFLTNVNGYIASEPFEDVEIPQPGDLIIFKSYQGAVNHIGILLSDKLWIGAQSKGVREVQMNNPYWSQEPHFFRRYKSGSSLAIKTSFNYHPNIAYV